MTESEWFTSNDPTKMFAYLYSIGKAYLRKSELFAIACSKRYGVDIDIDPDRDRIGTNIQWALAWCNVNARDDCIHSYKTNGWELDIRSKLIREIYGNPFKPLIPVHERYGDISCSECKGTGGFPSGFFPDRTIEFCDKCRGRGTVRGHISAESWYTPNILALAEATYNDHYSDNTLCLQRLAVLADALEENGCTESMIINHLRDVSITHVRGCHVLDLLCGKEN